MWSKFQAQRVEVGILCGALLAAASLKLALIFAGRFPFNSDEAVVALMARHILQGERPIFFYGQAYMSSLDAWLLAGGFALFGQHVWVIRLIQTLIYLGVLLTTAWLGREVFGSWRIGSLGALLLSIPTVNVTLYTTVSIGDYNEALLLGNLILIAGLQCGRRLREGKGAWYGLVWGLLAGLGVWVFGLTLVYALPSGLYILAQSLAAGRGPSRLQAASRAIFPALVGGLLGAAPWWAFAWQRGFSQLLGELGGGAVAGVERLPWIGQVFQHLVNFLLLGITVIFGLRPPWGVVWLALPLLPFVLIFWLAVLVYAFQEMLKPGAARGAKMMLAGVMVTVTLAFIFTSFGVDPSGRYFLPMAPPLALFAAGLIWAARPRLGRLAWALAVLVMGYNLLGTWQVARQFPPGLTTQFDATTQIDHRYDAALIQFLEARGELFGYTDYWVSYPLAFLSQERLIYVPRLPYHLDFRYTPRDDRYAPYDEKVASAGRVAYITARHAPLDQALRSKFASLGIGWQEIQIGDYQVFYALSRPVRPAEIDLGEFR